MFYPCIRIFCWNNPYRGYRHASMHACQIRLDLVSVPILDPSRAKMIATKFFAISQFKNRSISTAVLTQLLIASTKSMATISQQDNYDKVKQNDPTGDPDNPDLLGASVHHLANNFMNLVQQRKKWWQHFPIIYVIYDGTTMTTINLRNAFIVALVSICILHSQGWEETDTPSTVTTTLPSTRSKEDLDFLAVSVHHLANSFMDLVRVKYQDSAERLEAQRKTFEAIEKHDFFNDGNLSEFEQQNLKEYE